MTRVEFHNTVDPTEIRKEVHKQSRHRSGGSGSCGCGGCISLLILGFLGIIFFGVVIVAKTGLWEVPLLTERLYSSVEPVREVHPLGGYTNTDILQVIGLRAQYNPVSGQVSSFMIEEELTTLAVRGIEELGDDVPFEIKNVQLAIERGFIEVNFSTPTKKRDVVIQFNMIPEAKNGKFGLLIEEIIIGGVTVPDFLGKTMVGIISNTVIKSMNASLSDIGTLSNIKLKKGVMDVYLNPAL